MSSGSLEWVDLASSTGLSPLESIGLLVVVAAALYLYYHGPLVPTAGIGTPLTGRPDDPRASPCVCGPDCVVCPHCGVENAATYAYCRHCVGRL